MNDLGEWEVVVGKRVARKIRRIREYYKKLSLLLSLLIESWGDLPVLS